MAHIFWCKQEITENSAAPISMHFLGWMISYHSFWAALSWITNSSTSISDNLLGSASALRGLFLPRVSVCLIWNPISVGASLGRQLKFLSLLGPIGMVASNFFVVDCINQIHAAHIYILVGGNPHQPLRVQSGCRWQTRCRCGMWRDTWVGLWCAKIEIGKKSRFKSHLLCNPLPERQWSLWTKIQPIPSSIGNSKRKIEKWNKKWVAWIFKWCTKGLDQFEKAMSIYDARFSEILLYMVCGFFLTRQNVENIHFLSANF